MFTLVGFAAEDSSTARGKPLNWPEGAVEDSSTMCVPSTTRY
jgi:hypothetical protein